MKSVLFITYDSYPGNNANIQCISTVMEFFSAHGYDVHIACLKEHFHLPDELTSTDGIKVHYLPEILHAIRRTPDQEYGFMPFEIASKVVRYSIRNAQRLSIHDLAFGFDNVLLRNKVKNLISKHDIDTVITVSAPFITHLCYLKIRKFFPDVKWIIYELDPFTYNHFLPEKQLAKRKILEENVCKEADQIISTIGISEENDMHAFRQEYETKTLRIALPNFGKKSDSKPWQFEHDRINLVYTGTFYKQMRDPSAFLEILTKIPENILRFHVFGYGCEDEFSKYQCLKDVVFMHGPANKQTCNSVLDSADILVSFGNDCMNQIPSKIFTYFNTRKPIIHLYSCLEPVTEMLDNYPLHLCVENNSAFVSEKAQEILRFCQATMGKLINEEDLSKLRAKYGSETVCTKIMEFSAKQR